MRRALFAAALLATACAPQTRSASPASPSPAASETPVPIKIHSQRSASKYVTITEQRQNRKVYVLRADSSVAERIGSQTGRGDFTRPHVTFYDRSGKTLVADAPHATVEERTKQVVMTGGVHARTADGITLASDTLTYDDRNERLHGEGNVVVTTPRGERLNGDCIDADLRLSQMHITSAQGCRS